LEGEHLCESKTERKEEEKIERERKRECVYGRHTGGAEPLGACRALEDRSEGALRRGLGLVDLTAPRMSETTMT
jgi:hypothetical protein